MAGRQLPGFVAQKDISCRDVENGNRLALLALLMDLSEVWRSAQSENWGW